MDNIYLSVVIPAYNEERNLDGTVRGIWAYLRDLGLTYEILIVNDGSLDSTKDIAKKLSNELSFVRMIDCSSNQGKGSAVRTGMLEASGERILFTDADHATPIQELPALMSALDAGFEVAIGSRAVSGAVRVVHQPFYREIGGRALNLFIRMFAVPGIRDTQCGFKLFTRDAARSIFSRSIIERFSFDVEALYLAGRLGYRIAELPIHWSHHGNSRVNPLRDGLKMFSDIAKIRFHRYKGCTK
ncbi:MAG: dolichyl-phosphate beta-glucosyltransferase [Armatimonadota bacterium]